MSLQKSDGSTYRFRLLDRADRELVTVKGIFIDSYGLTKQERDQLRRQIIDQYRAGTPFADLAATHDLNGNPGGELPSFYEGMMVPEFDRATRSRRVGEIFPVDVNEQGWYYVVLKTQPNRMEQFLEGVIIELQ